METIFSQLIDEIIKKVFIIIFTLLSGKILTKLFPLKGEKHIGNVPYDPIECGQHEQNNRIGCVYIWFVGVSFFYFFYKFIGDNIYTVLHKTADTIFLVKPDTLTIISLGSFIVVPIVFYWQNKQFVATYGIQKELELTAYFSNKYNHDNRKFSKLVYTISIFISLSFLVFLFHFQANITQESINFTDYKTFYVIRHEKISDIVKIELIKGYFNSNGEYVKWPYYKFHFKSGACYYTECINNHEKEVKDIAYFLINKSGVAVKDIYSSY